MHLYLFKQFDAQTNMDVFLSRDWDITASPKSAYKTTSLSEAVDTLHDIGKGWTVVEADDIPEHRWLN